MSPDEIKPFLNKMKHFLNPILGGKSDSIDQQDVCRGRHKAVIGPNTITSPHCSGYFYVLFPVGLSLIYEPVDFDFPGRNEPFLI